MEAIGSRPPTTKARRPSEASEGSRSAPCRRPLACPARIRLSLTVRVRPPGPEITRRAGAILPMRVTRNRARPPGACAHESTSPSKGSERRTRRRSGSIKASRAGDQIFAGCLRDDGKQAMRTRPADHLSLDVFAPSVRHTLHVYGSGKTLQVDEDHLTEVDPAECERTAIGAEDVSRSSIAEFQAAPRQAPKRLRIKQHQPRRLEIADRLEVCVESDQLWGRGDSLTTAGPGRKSNETERKRDRLRHERILPALSALTRAAETQLHARLIVQDG